MNSNNEEVLLNRPQSQNRQVYTSKAGTDEHIKPQSDESPKNIPGIYKTQELASKEGEKLNKLTTATSQHTKVLNEFLQSNVPPPPSSKLQKGANNKGL